MSNTRTGICALTNKECELQLSHILPKICMEIPKG